MIDHVIHHTIELETTRISEIEVFQLTETNVTKTTDQETIPITDLIIKETKTMTIIGQETTHKIGIPTITIEEIIHNPLIETKMVTLIPNTSYTPKHQRQINQVQANEGTTSDPPGFDNTECTELQSNHNNCESTDSEVDTNNTISVDMITVENDYEPIIFEQPFSSHIYEK